MEDDVSTIIKVMQVVATVEASVAKHMIQEQLLKSQHNRGDTDRTKLSVTWSVESRVPTSTTLFFLVTLFFSTLSGSGAARLTGGLKGEQFQEYLTSCQSSRDDLCFGV